MIQWIWLVPDIAPAMAGAAVVAPPALLILYKYVISKMYLFPVITVYKPQ